MPGRRAGVHAVSRAYVILSVDYAYGRDAELDRDDARGVVDFHELGDIPMARPGPPLMRHHQPTAGADGRVVRGALLGARAGWTRL